MRLRESAPLLPPTQEHERVSDNWPRSRWYRPSQAGSEPLGARSPTQVESFQPQNH